MFAKKIVAGAALLALAGVAQAQVKIYGTVDASFGSFKVPGQKAITRVESGNMTTSFIGFGGSEDLGGGLKAEFALETFLFADTGGTPTNNAGNFWGRASNIALSGGFGKVTIGQYDNAFFINGLSYNPFGASQTFSPTMRHYYGLGSMGTAITGFGNAKAAAQGFNSLGFDTGWINSLTYESPNMSGFTFSIQWAPKETNAANAEDSITLGGAYNAGPLSLAIAYAKNGNSTVGNSVYSRDLSVFGLNGSYDFGMVKLFGQYTDIDVKTAGLQDESIYQLGVSVPVTTSGVVMASVGQYKTKNGTKDTIFSLGYDHTISKRTDAYVAFSNEKFTGVKGASSFAVGIRHNF